MSINLCVNAFDVDYAHLHSSTMRHDIPKLLRAMMKAGNLNQAKLARRLKVEQPTISRLLSGSEPKGTTLQRIITLAEEMGVISDVRSEDVADSLPARPQGPAVKLKGYVGAGSEMHYYRLADDQYEEVAAPPGATDQTVAVEIKGTSMGAALNSWLVFYDDVHSPVAPHMIGQLCVVGLADDRILIKKIERARAGSFRLVSNNPEEPPIENAEIEWAALVSSMRPR